MAAISLDPLPNLHVGKTHQQHGVVLEEIEGLLKVYKDGHVERPPIIPNVPCTTLPSELGVAAKDVVIDKFTNLWARIYVPSSHGKQLLPLLLYFHGGGFCVGSVAWSCYHDFLANLSSKAACVIMSINYRLAPENRLPAAYEDGTKALLWVKQLVLNSSCHEQKWWLNQCNVSSLFLAGDSAGANIAYNVATRLGSHGALGLKGLILIQPFFGGETRTRSEKHADQPANSALCLSASDTYWRLSLPPGAGRDHPWCNPLASSAMAKFRELRLPCTMVCASEMDILKDRNLEFSASLSNADKKVTTVVYEGVGHAFQVLQNSHLSHTRTREMMSHLKAFINQ